MGYRVIGFELESGTKLWGLYESCTDIILNWGFFYFWLDKERVKKVRFKDPWLRKELIKGCDPDSFFSCQYREDAEKVAELVD